MGPTLGGLCLEVGIEALHEMEETLPLHGSLYGLSYCFTELQRTQKSEGIKLLLSTKTRIQFLPFFDHLVDNVKLRSVPHFPFPYHDWKLRTLVGSLYEAQRKYLVSLQSSC